MTEPDGADKQKYVMAEAEAQAEQGRLEKLEGLHDAATLRRVVSIGIEAGSRCVEIGAGAGSIANGLAGRVDPEGLVLAVDIDPRFLPDFSGPRRHGVYDVQAVVWHNVRAWASC